jgi:phage-related protein
MRRRDQWNFFCVGHSKKKIKNPPEVSFSGNLLYIFAVDRYYKDMNKRKIKVQMLQEAHMFVESLPINAQKKIYYNILKIEMGVMDNELFKKLDGTNIWEIRSIYDGIKYRLFSFWDTRNGTIIIATHGIIKKVQKTPKKEIAKAEELRSKYFDNNKNI